MKKMMKIDEIGGGSWWSAAKREKEKRRGAAERKKEEGERVKPCDICGDIGVVEAIITCCECKASREHLYCMRVVRTEVPPFWTCLECEQKKLISPFTSDEQKLETPTKNVLSSPGKSARVLEGPKRPLLASRFHFKEKRVDTGRTQYLSCEEATKLSTGSNKRSKTPLRSVHGSPKSMPPPCERTPVKSPIRERTTQHERSKSLEPELKQPFRQQSASPNGKAVMPFTNKHDATPSIKSPERARTPIVSPSCERAAKFEPHLQQLIVQQSTCLKEKVVLSFHNKGCAARYTKSPVRTRTMAELQQEEETIKVKSDSQKHVVQKSTRPKGETLSIF
uniref:uncharacterized protein LOC122608965 n=1 Tax=Erigeron canadensis TaxID=72917 RepID=UPI001CB94BEE|nr:uncharacterized protein LOC122608965 [Erigeron canadensis]